jgi:toxin ParE1/3/4
MARIESHARFPLTGSVQDDWLPGLRRSTVSSYVVFFRPVGDTIEVLRVLHGSRDLKKIIHEDTEV